MTRNCPGTDYLFPTVSSFFSRRDLLTTALEIYSLRLREPCIHCLSVVDLEQLGEKLHDEEQQKNIITLLAPDERKIFSSFSYPKRRVEWLGGRIAAKTSTMLLLEEKIAAEHFPLIAILPRKNGSPEPRIIPPSACQLSVSISHSEKFAAGMAAYAPACGVDIQKITGQPLKVRSRFAMPDEISLLADKIPVLDMTQHLSLLWSAKEALKKSFLHDQPVIFQGVLLKMVRCEKHIILCLQSPGAKTPLKEVNAAVLGEYILAFTVQTTSHA